MAAPHLISSSNLLPSLIAAHQAHSEYKFLPSSILYQEETMITMTSSRCDGEGLVVIPLSHWRCFQCDLCGETFEPEDDPKNQRRAQHRNQCLVVIELSHQPLHWNATSLVFYPLLLLFWVGKYNEPPWNRNCHPCDPLINQQWLLAPQGL